MCRDPQARSDPNGESEPKLGDARFISFIFRVIKFSFQKFRVPNPRSDRNGGSKPEPGLLRRFQLSSQNILFGFLLNFRFQKCRDPNPRPDPNGRSEPEAGLLRRFQLSSQNILFVHFVAEAVSVMGKPIIIHNFNVIR